MNETTLHSDPNRTTPTGMARYADDFLATARVAFKARAGTVPGERVASVPVMFLVGQSIELSLKSYLLSQGVSLNQLRSRELGHGLRRSHKKAKELGLAQLVQLSPQELQAISILDELYASKQLQYIVTGAKSFPAFEFIESAAARLLAAVGPRVGYRPRAEGNVA